jgi:hypothetical protein
MPLYRLKNLLHRSRSRKAWRELRKQYGKALGLTVHHRGGWLEGSKTFEYLRQLVPTFLEKLFAEMIQKRSPIVRPPANFV